MGAVRTEVEGAPGTLTTIEATEDSYSDAIRVLARYFLIELDRRGDAWEPETDSATSLGDDLYSATREDIPAEVRDELSGGQVMAAAHLAYRAFKGD